MCVWGRELNVYNGDFQSIASPIFSTMSITCEQNVHSQTVPPDLLIQKFSGMEFSNACFNKPLSWFWQMLILENCCSKTCRASSIELCVYTLLLQSLSSPWGSYFMSTQNLGFILSLCLHSPEEWWWWCWELLWIED